MKVASAAADRWRPSVPGVVILLYHRVGGGSALEIDLDAARFDEQIAVIAESRRAVPLAVGLGMVLISIVVVVNALAWTSRRAGERLAG